MIIIIIIIIDNAFILIFGLLAESSKNCEEPQIYFRIVLELTGTNGAKLPACLPLDKRSKTLPVLFALTQWERFHIDLVEPKLGCVYDI